MSEIHSVGPFILGKSLGAGSTGKVKLGFHKDTGFKVAIKIMNKEVLSSRPSMRKKVEREIVVMKLIDHPNVLKLHDVYETSKYLFLVTEYVEGGELFDYLINKGSLEPLEALRFFQQLIRGLDHCHSQRICHRDLKPENLLLDSEKNIKIGDFGMAAMMRKGSLLGTSCGSPHYASPEVVTGKQYSGLTADVWSCGVILYALLTGKLPFDDDDIRKLLSKVKAGNFTMPAFLHKDAQDLIQRMLTVDPSKRITTTQIKEHPWFTANCPDPHYFVNPIPVEDMTATPLEDAAAIDDEIMRSLKVLGLGSDVEIEHALTSRKPNLTIVFYRILEERKEKQSNNSYHHSSRSHRPRSNTHDHRERSFSESQGNRNANEGKARSNSFTQPDNAPTRVLSLNSKSRRPSPLVEAKKGGSQGLIFPLSPSNSAGNHATFTVSEDSATILNIANSSSSEFTSSPQHSPRQHSPRTRVSPPLNHSNSRESYHRDHRDKDKLRKMAQSPPSSSPPMPSSSPININKSRITQLASEGAAQPLGSSPIIGSNPKRSWFSNFFSGSPHANTAMEEPGQPTLSLRDPANPPLPAIPQPTIPHPANSHPANSHPTNSHPTNSHPPNSHPRDQAHPRDPGYPRDPAHPRDSGYPRDPAYPRDAYPTYLPSTSPHSSYLPSTSPHSSSYMPPSSPHYPPQSPLMPSSSPHSPSYAQHINHSPASNPVYSPSNRPNGATNYTANFNRGVGFNPAQDPRPATSPKSIPYSIPSNGTKPSAPPPLRLSPPHSDTVARPSMEMQTGKSGVELGAEIQRTLSALKTSWRLHTNERYTAKLDGAEGVICQFSVELTDLKHNNLNLVSVSHVAGAHTSFEILCTRFQAEVRL